MDLKAEFDPCLNRFGAITEALMRDHESSVYAKDAGLAPGAPHPDVSSLTSSVSTPDHPETKADNFYPGRYVEVHLL